MKKAGLPGPLAPIRTAVGPTPCALDLEAGPPGPNVVVDPYAVARYTYLNAKLEIRDGGRRVDADKSRVDPVVGRFGS